jgi:hypothetical protein
MRSAAAGPEAYLAGSPGARPVSLPDLGFAGLPRLVHGRLVYTALSGGVLPQIWATGSGGCPRRVGEGTVDLVDPTGHGLTAFVQSERHMLDLASGRLLAKLVPGTYAWANDGQLVGADAKQVTLYSADGRTTRVVASGYYIVLGALGPTGVVLGTATATSLLDLASGQVTKLIDHRAETAVGSPDGRWLAVVDAGGANLVSRADGHTTALPRPGPVVGLAWSADSAWLAVQTPFGGAAVHADDGRVLDLGSVNVVSW